MRWISSKVKFIIWSATGFGDHWRPFVALAVRCVGLSFRGRKFYSYRPFKRLIFQGGRGLCSKGILMETHISNIKAICLDVFIFYIDFLGLFQFAWGFLAGLGRFVISVLHLVVYLNVIHNLGFWGDTLYLFIGKRFGRPFF